MQTCKDSLTRRKGESACFPLPCFDSCGRERGRAMGFRKDLTGQKFGSLTVLQFSHNDKKSRTFWLVSCDCGSPAKVVGGCHLTSGKTKSCGCHRENLRKTHGLTRTPEHVAWQNMIARCERPSHPEYYRYGGRGIAVCDEWRQSFDAFIDYIGPRLSGNHVLDRINNNGNYEPDNVRWVTPNESSHNRRTSSKTGLKGVGRQTKTGRWFAKIGVNGREIYLGTYDTIIEAAQAYDKAAVKFYGGKTSINFPNKEAL